MKTKRLLAAILMGAMTMGAVAGCGSSSSDTSTAAAGSAAAGASSEASSDASISIGFSMKTQNNPFTVSVRNGANQAAEDYGVNLTITDAELDSEKQMTDIETFMQKKVDVLLIDALDSTAIVPTIEDAYDAGFKIMTEDVKIPDAGDKISTHVGIDNKANGKLIAEYLADTLKKEGKSNVVIFEGLPGAEATLSRAEGFHEVLDDDPDINIIYAKNVGDQRSQGLEEMDDVLQKYDEIDAVVCCNDELALGVISAIEGAGREGIYVTGFDGTSDGLEAVKNGSMLATIDHKPYSMGYLAVESAVKLAKGEELEPSTIMEAELIDATNVDDAIELHASEAE